MKNYLTFQRWLLALVCLVVCSVSVAAHQHESRLLNYVYLGEFTAEQSKAALQKIPPLANLPVKYSMNVYRVTYRTPAPDGSMTTATGLAVFPIATGKAPAIVSYQHGTRVTRNDVPSSNNEKNYIYLAVFGSNAGYALSMPDYLGMGGSDLPVHPYVDAKTLASSSVDMLLATKELAAILHYQLSEKLFLAGYSQGGFSTMVMYEDLLLHHPEIQVTAAAPGSAPYDWKETLNFIVNKPGPRATVYLAYAFYTWQTYYHFWPDMSTIFKKPYDTLVPELYDGKHEAPEILAKLPQNPADAIQEDVLTAIFNGTDPHTPEIEANLNHYHFTATSPLLIIGTKGDRDVSYHGAEIAYEVLRSKSDKVTLRSVSDTLDHLQAFPIVTGEQLAFFKKFD